MPWKASSIMEGTPSLCRPPAGCGGHDGRVLGLTGGHRPKCRRAYVEGCQSADDADYKARLVQFDAELAGLPGTLKQFATSPIASFIPSERACADPWPTKPARKCNSRTPLIFS